MKPAIALCAAFGTLAQAQSALTFEVASVRAAQRQAPRRGMRAGGEIKGGPGTDDPERVTYEWCLMTTIFQNLFGTGLDRMPGYPDWIRMDRFDIVAKVPPGSTKDQVREMTINLLKERFHFAYHIEQKDFEAYNLVVSKAGPKLKDAAPPDGPLPPRPAPGTPAAPPALDQDGFPQLPAGRTDARGISKDGISRTTFRMSSPQQLVSMLALAVRPARVIDQTGLTGPYDFKLEYSTGRQQAGAEPAEPAPDIFEALEKQLGLKLEKTMIPLDVLVIEHLDRTPAGN